MTTDWIYWSASIEHQGKHWKSTHKYEKLEDAVNWVENELLVLEHLPVNEACTRPKMDIKERINHLKNKLEQSPYRVTPSDLEPKVIAYQVFIDIETSPISFESFENEFGETHKYSEKFLSPIKLTALVKLDPDLFKIEQPIGENTKWCRFVTLTNFYQEGLASSEAQLLWDQSKILQQYKSKTLIRARYGYKETETGYSIILGECADVGNSWVKQQENRQEYMERLAYRQTIFNSLDVNDLRLYLDLEPDEMSDTDLLKLMHEARVESPFVSEEDKKISRYWLIEHPSGK